MRGSATIRWVVRCLSCDHRHVDECQHVVAEEWAPPPAPTRCEECGTRLKRESYGWYRTMTVLDVDEPPGAEA